MLCLEVLGEGSRGGKMRGEEEERERTTERGGKIKLKLSAVGKLGYCTRKQWSKQNTNEN